MGLWRHVGLWPFRDIATARSVSSADKDSGSSWIIVLRSALRPTETVVEVGKADLRFALHKPNSSRRLHAPVQFGPSLCAALCAQALLTGGRLLPRGPCSPLKFVHRPPAVVVNAPSEARRLHHLGCERGYPNLDRRRLSVWPRRTQPRRHARQLPSRLRRERI
jgi:hypothetical protein